jgi:hypothetical protein
MIEYRLKRLAQSGSNSLVGSLSRAKRRLHFMNRELEINMGKVKKAKIRNSIREAILDHFF